MPKDSGCVDGEGRSISELLPGRFCSSSFYCSIFVTTYVFFYKLPRSPPSTFSTSSLSAGWLFVFCLCSFDHPRSRSIEFRHPVRGRPNCSCWALCRVRALFWSSQNEAPPEKKLFASRRDTSSSFCWSLTHISVSKCACYIRYPYLRQTVLRWIVYCHCCHFQFFAVSVSKCQKSTALSDARSTQVYWT